MKKKISLYLALIMFINVMIPAAFPAYEVQAAAQLILNVNEEFKEYLTLSANNNTPDRVTTQTAPQGQVCLSWDLSATPNSSSGFKTGMYVLRYYNENNKKVELTLQMQPMTGLMSVNYNVYQYNNSINTPIFENISTTGAALNFGVHTPLNKTQNYVPITRYFSPINYNGGNDTDNDPPKDRVNNYNPSLPYDAVTNPNDAAGMSAWLTRLTPSFNISQGKGYSFTYDGTNVNFLWDSTRQRFYFDTDSIQQGRIYDFQLEYYSDENKGAYNPLNSRNKDKDASGFKAGGVGVGYVFTGVEEGSLTIVPFAAYETGGTIVDNTRSEYKSDGRVANTSNDPLSGYNTSYLAMPGKYTVGGLAGKDIKPATPSNGLDIRFNLPKTYNENDDINKRGYSGLPTFDLPITLELNQKDTAYSFGIEIASAYELSPTAINVPNEGIDKNGVLNAKLSMVNAVNPVTLTDASLLQTVGSADSDRVRIRLDDMPAGLIYQSVDIKAPKPNNIAYWYRRDTNVSGNTRLHTFLDYNIVTINSKQYIDIIPYGMNTGLRTSGWYRLMNSGRENVRVESKGGEHVLLPISPLVKTQYEVEFSISGTFDTNTYFQSQIIEYTPQKTPAAVGTPDNFTLSEVNLTPLKGALNDKSGDLSFHASWDVGDASQIQELVQQAIDATSTTSAAIHITYDLKKATAPTSTSADYDTYRTVVLHVYTVTTTTGSALWVEYEGNDITNTQPQPLPIRVDRTTGVDKNVYYVDLAFLVSAGLHGEPFTTEPDFRYPDIYFMNIVRVSLEQQGSQPVPLTPMPSLFDTMTLNSISLLTVPPPRSLTVKPVGETPVLDVGYIIPGDSIKQYLDTLGQYPPPTITTDVYIGQYESAIKTKFYPENKTVDLDTRRGTLPAATIDYDELWAGTIDFTNLLDALRNGVNTGEKTGVICIKDVPLLDSNGDPVSVENSGLLIGNPQTIALTFTGLDANQKYYVFADTVIELPYDPAVPIVDYSIPSVLVGATTASAANIPDSSEKVPSAPKLNVYKDSIDQTSATLYWDRISPDPGETGVTIEYEIIRLKDRQMTNDEFISMDNDFMKFLNSINNNNKVGWRTDNDQVNRLYPSSGSALYEYNVKSDPITFKDGTLLPNQLYFYYVRTVRTVTGSAPRYSSWSRASVTSIPVQGPFNLKPETDLEYDRKTEAIVSFDVPALDIAKLGTDYKLQYQIKADNGAWSDVIDMDLSQLKNTNNYTISADGKTIHFIYKLTGLNPNTLYSMRVRLYDMNANDGSLYSNIAQFKTNVNQQEYDDEHNTDEWLNYLQKLLAKLVTDPYWIARENTSELVVVYRPGDMFNGLLGLTHDAAMAMYTNNADTATYYIPASALLAANDANKGFRVVYNDLNLLLSPKMINTNYNEAVTAIAGYLKGKEISDYFVRMTVTRSRVSGLIEGEQALGKQTAIEIDLIGVKTDVKDIKTWDNDLYRQFAKMLDDKLNDATIRANLSAQVKKGTVSEDMVAYVEKIANDIKSDMLKTVYNQIRTGSSGILSTRSVSVAKLDTPMILIAGGLDSAASVSGYQLQNAVWMPRTVSEYYNGKGMAVSVPGTYVFTGHTVNIPGIDDAINGGAATSLVAKYALDDYLGRDAINLNQNATRLMVAGCVARVAGAPKTADPITWIATNLNMTLSSRNATGNVQNQEALAMLMALYEKKTNTKVSSITIRNFTTTAGMTGLDNRYAQAVRAAFEIGLVSDTSMKPTGAVTIGRLLDMLTALDSKIKL